MHAQPVLKLGHVHHNSTLAFLCFSSLSEVAELGERLPTWEELQELSHGSCPEPAGWGVAEAGSGTTTSRCGVLLRHLAQRQDGQQLWATCLSSPSLSMNAELPDSKSRFPKFKAEQAFGIHHLAAMRSGRSTSAPLGNLASRLGREDPLGCSGIQENPRARGQKTFSFNQGRLWLCKKQIPDLCFPPTSGFSRFLPPMAPHHWEKLLLLAACSWNRFLLSLRPHPFSKVPYANSSAQCRVRE